jgi:hypothetical protein
LHWRSHTATWNCRIGYNSVVGGGGGEGEGLFKVNTLNEVDADARVADIRQGQKKTL